LPALVTFPKQPKETTSFATKSLAPNLPPIWPMAPSAITPPHGVQQASELTAAAVAEKIAQTAPGLLKK